MLLKKALQIRTQRPEVIQIPARPQIELIRSKLALDSVKEDIASFGGDPLRITIFGKSA